MVKRKRRGQLAKTVRNLCSGTLLEPVNKPEFKKGLRKIIDEYPSSLVNIGRAIQSWAVEYLRDKIKIEETWRLVDEVEPRIRQKFEKSVKQFFGTD